MAAEGKKKQPLIARIRLNEHNASYWRNVNERHRSATFNDLIERGIGNNSEEILGFKDVVEAFNVRLSASEIFLEQCATVTNMLVEQVNALTAEMEKLKAALVEVHDANMAITDELSDKLHTAVDAWTVDSNQIRETNELLERIFTKINSLPAEQTRRLFDDTN